MTFVPVSDIPNNLPYKKKKDVRGMLDEFIMSDIACAQVILDDDDYCRKESARQSINHAITAYRYPITVMTRRGEIYLTRNDI